MNQIKDDFGTRCRARTKAGKRCSKRSQWLTPICAGRESWLAALRTGWPRMVRGMKEPDYHTVGLCRVHGDETKHVFLYGIGKLGPAKRDGEDAEYEAAKRDGDEACQRATLSWRESKP